MIFSRRLRRSLVGALLVCLSAGIGVAPARASEPALKRYPYLTDAADTVATINWATDQSSTTASVTWGEAGNEPCTAHVVSGSSVSKKSITVNSVDEYQWKALLTGLQPATAYCYRVMLDTTDLLGTDTSPVFSTLPSPGGTPSYSFAVLGDWGAVDDSGANADQANVMSQIASSGADFAISTGDIGYAGGNQTDYGDLTYSKSSVFAPNFWTIPGRSIPHFPVLGNHGSNSVFLNNWPQDRTVSSSDGRYVMETYCCLNGTTSNSYPSSWYARTIGNARFYFLDASWSNSNVGTSNIYQMDHDYHWTTSSDQYVWLKNDLAANAGTPLKFAVFHFPLYSDQLSEASDTYLQIAGPDGQDSLEGLFSQYGVDMVFNGHAHLYERNIKQNGIITYVTGGGGGELESVGPCHSFDAYAIGWSDSSNTGKACGAAPVPDAKSRVFHFLLVRVSGGTVTVTPTDELGRVFDQQVYTLGDVTPPSQPTGLQAAGTSQTSLSLSWNASNDNVGISGYDVSVNGTHVGSEPTTTTASYTVNGLSCGTSYSISVRAVDTSGNQSTPASTTGSTAACPGVTVTFSAPTSLSGPVVATFSRDVTGVSASNFVLRVAGSSANLAASVSCKNVGGSSVSCTGTSVRTSLLSPASPLVSGQHYVAWVNPAGTSSPVRDRNGVVVPAAQSQVFRGALVQQEDGPGAAYQWGTVASRYTWGGSYTRERLPGARATFAFTGSSVGWYTIIGPDQGTATISIDGVPIGTINNFANRVHYNVLRSFAGLSSAAHTITITVTGQKGAANGLGTFVSIDAMKAGSGTLQKTPSLLYAWRSAPYSAASGGRYVVCDQAGAQVSLPFRGTGLDWYTVFGIYNGKAAIYLDGTLNRIVDTYRSSTSVGRITMRGLSDALHTVRIVVLGQRSSTARGTSVIVDRFVVL